MKREGMKVSRERKKEEALKRMRSWKLFDDVVYSFEHGDVVMLSEPPLGACYCLDEAQMARVRAFEEQFNALVYHVVRSFTNFGEMESYMYVSDYPEEWQTDRDDIAENQQLAYVQNLDMPCCSEFGTIGVRLSMAAGLERIW